MRASIFRPLAQALLLAGVLSTASSCQILGPLIAMPFRLLGQALGMVSSNPIGTAAAGAALF
jgi:hypothetical protein